MEYSSYVHNTMIIDDRNHSLNPHLSCQSLLHMVDLLTLFRHHSSLIRI